MTMGDKYVFTNHMESTGDPSMTGVEIKPVARLDPAGQSIVDYAGNWPEDYKYENGNYENRCCHCHNHFLGYKRRVSCKLCTVTTPSTLEEVNKKIREQTQALIEQIAKDLGLPIMPSEKVEEIIGRYRNELSDVLHEDGSIDIIKLASKKRSWHEIRVERLPRTE